VTYGGRRVAHVVRYERAMESCMSPRSLKRQLFRNWHLCCGFWCRNG